MLTRSRLLTYIMRLNKFLTFSIENNLFFEQLLILSVPSINLISPMPLVHITPRPHTPSTSFLVVMHVTPFYTLPPRPCHLVFAPPPMLAKVRLPPVSSLIRFARFAEETIDGHKKIKRVTALAN